jgi:CopG family nickel-responsive transcriptional regulator
MERFTVSIDAELMEAFDAFITRRGYRTRSEAIRDIVRERLKADQLRDNAGECVACLSYVFNHEERELVRRLTHTLHGHHDLARSTMHVHLDHEDCMEITVLEGPVASVTALAEAVTSETGVRHGQLNLVPVATDAGHAHPHADAHGHRHRSPKL